MLFSKFLTMINAAMPPVVFNVCGTRPRILRLWNFAADIDEKSNSPKNEKGILVWCYIVCAQNNIHLEYILQGGNNYFKDYL